MALQSKKQSRRIYIMAKMIEELTEAQKARMPEYRDKWIKIGLSTQPSDRDEAEAAVDEIYRQEGLEPPKVKVWLNSPMAGAVAFNMRMDVFNKTGIEGFASGIKDAIGPVMEALIAGKRPDKKYDKYRNGVGDCIHGQHDAALLSMYEYFLEVCGINEVSKMSGLFRLAKSSGWVWPLELAAIMTERPVHLAMEDRTTTSNEARLHCENRAALEYPDGWGVYSWHGVRVPQDIILNPAGITADRVLKESNAEVRRVMMERMGFDKLLQQSDAKLLNRDKFGELYSLELPGDEPLVMVKVKNSTPEPDGSIKDYFLRVAPGVRTAHEAVASTFGLTVKEYNPIKET